MSYSPSLAFLTGSVGTGEWIVLFVVILIVVGPKRLPEIARKIGRTMEMFRRAADEFKDQLMNMDQEPVSTPTSASASDVDGAPSEPAMEGDDSSGSYEDAYSNMADYPGNEDQVENWSSDATSEPLATGAAAERAEDAGEPPATGAETDKPPAEAGV